MDFWCCSFLFVTCVHSGVIFCSLYFTIRDLSPGQRLCLNGQNALKSMALGSSCKMEEHSSALHCVQQSDQCRSLCSQKEHICYRPSILLFYSVWFRCSLAGPKYLDTKGMWKRGNKNFQATWYYIFTKKKTKSDLIFMCLFSLKIKMGVCKSSVRNFHHTGTVNRSMLAGWGTCGKPFTQLSVYAASPVQISKSFTEISWNNFFLSCSWS